MHRLGTIRRKLLKSLKTNGLLGTVKLILMQPILHFQEARSVKKRNRIQETFDNQYGTDTGGVIPLSELSVDSPNWIYGGRYGPTSPERFRECVAMLPVMQADLRQFTFIDLGSGKGATLLYAAAMGFHKVVGVEFVRALHEVAEANVRRYPMKETRVELVCGDASDYKFPEEPLVVFASNPFSRELMNKVLENLSQHHGTVYFIHENAVYSVRDLPASGFLRRLASDAVCSVYVRG